MNMFTLKEKDEDVRIECQQKQKQEFKFVGKIKKNAGHTLFSYNVETKEIKPAPIKRTVLLTFENEVCYKEEVSVEKSCIYLQALNERNFVKKLKKMGYI